MCFVGCSKSEQNRNTDEYYVKYVFGCQIIQYGKTYAPSYSVAFTNSDLKVQTRRYKSAGEEEIICGPFKYGDNINVSLAHDYYDNVGGSSYVQTHIEIHVSKNNSPFALRKTKESTSKEPYTTAIQYSIDY